MLTPMSRRTFMHATASATVGILMSSSAFAASSTTRELRVTNRILEVNGKAAKVYGLAGPDGRPGLDFVKGGRFAVRLVNETSDPTLIHWHGLTPPWAQDGVPGVTQELLSGGSFYDYDFPLTRSGTNWMHAHTLQEQNLLAAPLIIREHESNNEQEIVILLHDFSFQPPEKLLAQLQGSDKPAHHMSGEMVMDHAMPSGAGSQATASMDLNDINYDAYLANDRTLADPEVTMVEAGSSVRLRIINGATATAFTVDLGNLTGDLIAVDGIDVNPVVSNRFPISMGQRLDVRIKLPPEKSSWPILFLREGALERTGVILAAKGAAIKKLASDSSTPGPILDWSLEQQLQAMVPLSPRPTTTVGEFDLVGTMSPYQWNMRRIGAADSPLTVKLGDRVEITMNNRSMMAHPMHLHGHHFQVVALGGKRLSGAVRDTLLIPPMTSATIAFDADNPGPKWAFHCHHLYHMATGMMTFVEYADSNRIQHHPGSTGD